MIGGVDVAMTRRDERDDADAICTYFLQFWPNMVVRTWKTSSKRPTVFRYDESNDPLPDDDFEIFKDQDAYENYMGAPAYTENMVEIKIDFDAVSLILGESWDISAVVAHFYRYGEHSGLLA